MKMSLKTSCHLVLASNSRNEDIRVWEQMIMIIGVVLIEGVGWVGVLEGSYTTTPHSLPTVLGPV